MHGVLGFVNRGSGIAGGQTVVLAANRQPSTDHHQLFTPGTRSHVDRLRLRNELLRLKREGPRWQYVEPLGKSSRRDGGLQAEPRSVRTAVSSMPKSWSSTVLNAMPRPACTVANGTSRVDTSARNV